MSKPGDASFSAWFAERQGGSSSGSGQLSGAMAPASTSFLGSLMGGGGADPEAGRVAAPPAAGSAAASPAAPSLLGFLPSAVLGAIGGGGGGGGGGGAQPAAPAPEPEWTCGMNAVQRFQAFGMLLLASLLLYLVSIFVFLPMVIIMPSKCVFGEPHLPRIFSQAPACAHAHRSLPPPPPPPPAGSPPPSPLRPFSGWPRLPSCAARAPP
jgi:hypothetical protein